MTESRSQRIKLDPEDGDLIAGILRRYAADAPKDELPEVERLIRVVGRHGARGYRVGCRCDVCRAGSWARVKALRSRGIAADDPRHGSNAGYAAGCRCPLCAEGRRAYERDWRARKAGRGA